MYGLRKRVSRLCGELGSLMNRNIEKIDNIYIREGKLSMPCKPSEISDGFVPYKWGAEWTDTKFNSDALFRFNIDIPEMKEGCEYYLNITTNQKGGGHNMLRPQMSIYIDDIILQGMDTNHENVKVTAYSGKGVKEVNLYVFSGMPVKTPYGDWVNMNDLDGERLYVYLQVRDKRVEEYYYNVETPYQYLKYMDENSEEYQKILGCLNDSLSIIDIRNPYSEEFYESLKEANDFLKENLYNQSYNMLSHATLVGHTHIDVAWLWQYLHTRDKAVRSFATEVNLLNEYDEHRFMSSQAQLYEYVKEDQPDLYEQIKKLVAEGKWEPEGSMWVEPDMNLISGESIVRQILYGKRFFKDEFDADCKILWLPDVFGYTAALPQILEKSGVKYFMTAKLSTNQVNRFPYDTFTWKGIDGSEVLSHCLNYTNYTPNIENGEIFPAWKYYNQKDINDDILILFGYADGGGGVTAEQIERLKRLEKGLPGVPKVKLGTASDYFERLENKVSENKHLPIWNGEIYYENHRGTYTSMGRIKKQNRKCEFLLSNAQWLWMLRNVFENDEFPKNEFDKAMKIMLLNQFHDVLPGTSIKEVYEDTDALYKEAFAIGEDICKSAICKIIEKGSDTDITVFNPYCEPVCGYVEHNDELIYVENVPAKGYAVYKAENNIEDELVSVEGNIIENQFYIIRLSDSGEIESLFDKKAGRECFKTNANHLRVFDDKPLMEDNWNLDAFYTEREYDMPKPDKVYLKKKTGEYAIIRTERKYMNSSIVQDMIVYARSPRIDFKTDIDWKEHSHVLKAEFPVDVNAVNATYEIQFGYVQRPTICNTSWDEARFEVCAHKWADISDNGYGMALLNDCKYGYSAKNSTISLTLLRCGCYPNPDADKEKHSFTYSILPHSGSFCDADVVKEAYLLNNPLFAVPKAVTDAYSLVECTGAVLDTIKPSEVGDGWIFRIYEPYNKSENVKLKCGFNVKKAEFTDLMETEKIDIAHTVNDNEIEFSIKPFEIVTLKVWM